jgi:nucleotide-binding universal stress UspA family protein
MTPTPSNARIVVLVALAGEPPDREVLRAGAKFARMTLGGELHIVHVMADLPLAPAPSPMTVTRDEIVQEGKRKLDALLNEARGQFPGRIHGHLAEGTVSKQVLQTAIDIEADVVLVGTHGRSGVKRLVLGSVAEAVVRGASCPVIVVRPKDYHAFTAPEIEPPCTDCLRVQRETAGARMWCERHSQHHPHGRLHYEMPQGFGAGSQLLRP